MDAHKLTIDQIIDIIDDDDDEYVAFLDIATTIKTKQILKRKRQTNIDRDIEGGYSRIYYDYLCENPKYPEYKFRRRFRMSSTIFRRLWREIPFVDSYFTQQEDALGRAGVTPLQKIVAALRMLTYGESADRQDEYVQISESTAQKAFKHFCAAVCTRYKKEYLREPTSEDLRRILQVNTLRGFPGMIGM
tara:strand:- start:1353 stop:1922 length:570 start_codon:yes stop_codon:yes gene_type:complete